MRRGVYRHKVHPGACSEHRFSYEIWHFPAPGLISGKPKLAIVSLRYGSTPAGQDVPVRWSYSVLAKSNANRGKISAITTFRVYRT